MDSFRETAAQLDADRYEAWKRMSFGERLLAGAELFDIGVMMMRTGIRLQHPDASDDTVNDLVRERLRLSERLESRHDEIAGRHSAGYRDSQ